MSTQRFNNVRNATGNTSFDAANMKARAELMQDKIDNTLANMLAAAEIQLEMRLKKAA